MDHEWYEDYNEDDEDYGRLSVWDERDSFTATISWTNCCGVKDVHDWSKNFDSQQACDAVMDEWLSIAREEVEAAFFMFVTVKDITGDLLDNYFSRRPNCFKTEPRVNPNSGNTITVWMVGV